MLSQRRGSFWCRLGHHLVVSGGAVGLTFSFFMVLPLIQAISKPPGADLVLQTVDTASLPPPPPPPEPEPEEEPEEEPEPELIEESQPLDLSQLELALNPSFGDGLGVASIQVDLAAASGGKKEVDALFSLSDLDQKPRVTYQPHPVQDARTRKKAPGTAVIMFVVNERGRVEQARVRSADDPVFERPALAAVKKWRFEPGMRKGKPVRFRMLVPITFPKGS